MNFEYSEEQKLLGDSISRYLQQNYSFEQRRAITGSGQELPSEVWREAAELGWLGIPFADSDGGLGGGAIELTLLFEALGRHLVVEPFLETLVLGGGLLRRLATTSEHRGFLAQMISGELQCALAHAESGLWMEVSGNLATVARQEANGYRIDGSKPLAYNSGAADILLVTARLEDDIAIFIVPASASTVRKRCFPTVDGRHAAEVVFEGTQVGRDALLASGVSAREALEATLDEALIALAAEQVGMMGSLLTATVEYTRTRRQFGQAISQFQVLQHRLADMFIAKELSTSLLLAAAIKLDERAPDARRHVAAAKAYADKSAKAVAYGAFQLHGAIASADELPIGHYLKRVTLISQVFGGIAEAIDRYRHA